MDKWILEIIIIPLIFLCFWIPFICGKKRLGIITSAILLVYFILISIWLEAIFLIIAYVPLFFFCIIFLSYWILRKYKLRKVALIAAIILALTFSYIGLSPWISDWKFSAKDAKEILINNHIELKNSIELISNESGGLRDYYHIFKVKLSESDFMDLKKRICENSNYKGELDYIKLPDISNSFDILMYEDKYDFIKEYYLKEKQSDGTFHIVLKLSKTDKTLEYIASDE